jgi:23S rRNA pseudouridine1911/1915/1917 synthase
MKLDIGKEFDGMTVRDLLTYKLELSRRCISSLKNHERGIVLNGQKVTVRAVLSDGDVLELTFENEGAEIVPKDIPIEILYEDDAISVVNKPAGMPTILSHGHYEDTLANALAYRYRDKDFVMRAVNRLDRDTSGVCLVANSRRSAYILCEQMKDRGMEKKYLALLDGVIDADNSEKIIKNYIKRKEGSTMMREVSAGSDGDISETHYRLFATGKRYSAVIAEPKTGRTHQLRVHFSHIGYPITGDTMYGSANEKISRQALHAFELTFTHPYTKEKMTFRAPVPDDMLALMSEDGIDCAEL